MAEKRELKESLRYRYMNFVFVTNIKFNVDISVKEEKKKRVTATSWKVENRRRAVIRAR